MAVSRMRFTGWAGHLLTELFLVEPDRLGGLLSPAAHPPLFKRQRARFAMSRVRMVAGLFAVLTPLWIVVDVAAFPRPVWSALAVARLIASTAFVGLALFCRCPPTPRHSYQAMAALFAVPSAFFLFSKGLLQGADLDAAGTAMAAGYIFLPFVLMAGLGVFPLTLLETAVFALPLLLVAAAPLLWHLDAGLPGLNALVVLWLLALIGAVSGLTAMSQLQLMANLFQKSAFDPLTTAFNRRAGEELMALQFEQARRYGHPLSLVFLDLDDFKRINDTAGHHAGDAVLCETARSLREAVRAGDAVIRWGGEEFLLVLPHTDAGEAERLLRRLCTAGACRRPDGTRLTFSAGIAESVRDGLAAPDWRALAALADRRMYWAKTGGKARIVTEDADETRETGFPGHRLPQAVPEL